MEAWLSSIEHAEPILLVSVCAGLAVAEVSCDGRLLLLCIQLDGVSLTFAVWSRKVRVVKHDPQVFAQYVPRISDHRDICTHKLFYYLTGWVTVLWLWTASVAWSGTKFLSQLHGNRLAPTSLLTFHTQLICLESTEVWHTKGKVLLDGVSLGETCLLCMPSGYRLSFPECDFGEGSSLFFHLIAQLAWGANL